MTVSVIQAVTADFPNGGSGATATASITVASSSHSLIAVSVGYGSNVALPAYAITGWAGSGNSGMGVRSQGNFTEKLETAIHYLHLATAGAQSVVSTNAAGSFSSYGKLIVLEVAGLANAGPVTNGTGADQNVGSTTPDSGASGSVVSIANGLLVAAVNVNGNSAAGLSPNVSGLTLANQANLQNPGTPAFTAYSVDTAVGQALSGILEATYGTMSNPLAWAGGLCVFGPASSSNLILLSNPQLAGGLQTLQGI